MPTLTVHGPHKDIGYKTLLAEILGSKPEEFPAYPVSHKLKEAINSALGNLPERYGDAVRYRFGLDTDEKMTFAEVGGNLYNTKTGKRGVGNQMARSMVTRSIQGLRRPAYFESILAADETGIIDAMDEFYMTEEEKEGHIPRIMQYVIRDRLESAYKESKASHTMPSSDDTYKVGVDFMTNQPVFREKEFRYLELGPVAKALLEALEEANDVRLELIRPL